ncbi:MAG: cation-translocating P-type ATPase [Algoriphagus sp.]|nr:cation-translocating P-type ATPase [Algoriphagus sp.]
MRFYQASLEQLYLHLQTSASGLEEEEAKHRSQKLGLNVLLETKKNSAFVLFTRQFKDLMILILAGAALLSGWIGDWTDTLIILGILLLNAVLGFVQEYKAEKALESLKKLTQTQSKVLRSQKVISIPASQLVVGDVILLEAGNQVPADIRLLEGFSLKIDESSLTGESLPVDKRMETIPGENLSPGDQFNMGFKGTLVTHGRAKGLVVAIGMNTELGKIASLLEAGSPRTPLQQRMHRFSKVIALLIVAICVLLFLAGLGRGEELLSVLLLSVSLAVAAIPEALPALITIALSLGASRLAKGKALVRKLPAVESLGAVTYICTDKTGTLTENKLAVVRTEAASESQLVSGYSNLQLVQGLCHDVHLNAEDLPVGEATELALVEQLLKEISRTQYRQLNSQLPRKMELPFDSVRKRMSTLHPLGNQFLVLCKGAPESIAAVLEDPIQANQLTESAANWARQGERVLAFAGKLLDSMPSEEEKGSLEQGLSYYGLISMIDPPREGVKKAIQDCFQAGITPVMITGDHPTTAKAIAEAVGIWKTGSVALTGTALAQLSDADFAQQVEQVSVYARVAPEQKLRIVHALQQKGHFTAMTGDGVNDAPSLKAATIGIAMGITGTDVSKEAAHLILLDDNFSTIVKAIQEGRRIYDTIVRFIKYILTCNGAEIWVIGLAPFLGLPIPLLPIHILWINLVTDGLPALALANEGAEPDSMRRLPRAPKQSLFANGVGYHILWVGGLMAAVTLFTQYLALQQGWHWQTMVFSVLSFSQLGHVLAIRSDRTFLFKQGILSNKPLLLAVGGTCVLQLAVIYLPFFNDLFKTEALSLGELAACLGMSALVFHAVELEKWLRNQLFPLPKAAKNK